MIYAPVIIPTLNRHEHFRQCLESLEKCTDADKTDVYVALDFPPSDKYVEGWKKNDVFLKEKESDNGFKSLTVYRRETNYFFSGKGNGKVAIEDATVGVDRYVFSEDDNVFSPNFLVYMNKCLEKYKDDDSVVAVCGYSYPVEWDVDSEATCFRQQINNSAWGTGYWKEKCRVRNQFIYSGDMLRALPYVIKERKYEKMIDVCLLEYITAACSPTKKVCKSMWVPTDMACRSYLAVKDKYAITPVKSLVRNLGFDGSGVYCQTIDGSYGDTAGTYNYSKQPIGTSLDFELVEDTKHAHAENRHRLNAFDYRSPNQMRRVQQLLWLCKNISPTVAKIYCSICFPFDMIPKVKSKIYRKFGI